MVFLVLLFALPLFAGVDYGVAVVVHIAGNIGYDVVVSGVVVVYITPTHTVISTAVSIHQPLLLSFGCVCFNITNDVVGCVYAVYDVVCGVALDVGYYWCCNARCGRLCCCVCFHLPYSCYRY